MKRFITLAVLAVFVIAPMQASTSQAAAIPTFSITAVVTDSTVTIQTFNFPKNDTFNVRMGLYGTQAIGGTLVTTQASGAGGSFTATYNIPAGLKGQQRIAIRLESPTSGYYAYNWFWNNTTTVAATATPGPSATPGPTATPGGPTATPAPTKTPNPNLPASGFPSFTITAVDRNNTVTIKGTNFTKNDTYTVRMGNYGTLAIGGTVVDSAFKTDATGAFTATFNIPAGLKDLSRIAIRMDSPSTGYYAFNWFWNNDHP